MSKWLKRIVDEGVLTQAQPLLDANKEKITHLAQQGKAALQQHGVIAPADPRTAPQQALQQRLQQLLRHLLQLPEEQALIMVKQLLRLLPQLLALHPKLRGITAVANMLGWGAAGSNTQGRITSLAGALGGSPWLSQIAQGGQRLVDGQQEYQQQLQRQRHYQQLNPVQQQAVDLATMLLALLQATPLDPVSVNQGVTELERLLQSQFVEVVAELDEQHGAALNGICYGPWPRLS
ncbi:hypothetical protein [uncultured Ferrimonas sp.]|uniref:hypothetical protein n=1 Tax=uncultured Ferrimonas sp. TaxID=432640 RepID=UPI00263A1C43|nr:hypothetical protein [uncultured Ferrimonas sp.]